MPLPPDDPTSLASTTMHGGAAAQTGTDAGARRHHLAPGAIIAGRYRVVALLGRGGMGDVYRADDLTLEQPVALKFLPPETLADPSRLSRFHNELRTARQVAHKNVCRVYDFGEADGHLFLTMEYVDGEDLATLLRRIGRIPHDKAVQIARQLCAGIAAAHDRGVLHRDLKPANVMLDGRGDVRITDFGIATAAGEATREMAGTLHYMAPELFAGGAASVQSDLYALGLMLFEIFTGRRSHEWSNLDELRQFHRTGSHATPSTFLRDIDPAVERIIDRCLQRDPGLRPASAIAIAAALPGSDVLADALAAGETPSPALLASAGEAGALGVVPGVLMVAAALAALLLFAATSSRVSTIGRTPLELPPEVLQDRASQVLRTAGYDGSVPGRASGFRLNGDYLAWLERTRPTPSRWDVLASSYPTALRFWYRESRHEMHPAAGLKVTDSDPVLTFGDMRRVILDSSGRLLELRAVPPRLEESGHTPDVATAARSAWPALFAAAGLEFPAFTPALSQWTPTVFADARLAWEGPMPDRPDQRLRVEAAEYRGRPVAFQVVAPWTFPDGVLPSRISRIDRWLLSIIAAVVLAFVMTAVALARRHLRTGRADVRGATKLALYTAGAQLLALPLEVDGRWTVDGAFGTVFRAASRVVLVGLLLWTVYLGLEPYVRRFWPHSLLGWSRVLAGRLRDPRVGRDVLTGVLFGIVLAFVDLSRVTLLPWLGYPSPRVNIGTDVELLTGAAPLAVLLISSATSAIQYSLLAILIIVVLRLAAPWTWLASALAAACLSVSTWNHMTSSTPWLWAMALVSGALLTLVAVRFGLLTLAVAWFVWSVVYDVPMTMDTSHWSATASNWTLATVTVLTVAGFVTARAGLPLFQDASRAREG